MKAMTTTLTLAAMVALSASAPVFAADWSQKGDYYAPSKTIVQRATPELRQFQGGDFYTTEKTVMQRPTAQGLNQFRQGDFYEFTNSN
jgi:hypothetical protein